MSARTQIDAQRRFDAPRDSRQSVLLARIDAIFDAQRALAEDEHGARDALRGALVDLAAICEEFADEVGDTSLTPGEAAGYLGVEIGTVSQLVASRRVAARRVEGRVAIDRDSLDAAWRLPPR